MNLRRRLSSGRPRIGSERERWPNGHVKQADPRLNNLWQRIKQYGVRAGIDPRLESEIGRLTLFGHLTPTDFEAANRFAVTVAKWELVMDMPRRTSASPSYIQGRGGVDNSEVDPEIVSEAKDAYHKMMLQIPANPAHIRIMLESVCVDNHICPASHYADLHLLLERLAKLWGMR